MKLRPWPSEPAAADSSACLSAAVGPPRLPGKQSPPASHNASRSAAEQPATSPPSAAGEEGRGDAGRTGGEGVRLGRERT